MHFHRRKLSQNCKMILSHIHRLKILLKTEKLSRAEVEAFDEFADFLMATKKVTDSKDNFN